MSDRPVVDAVVLPGNQQLCGGTNVPLWSMNPTSYLEGSLGEAVPHLRGCTALSLAATRLIYPAG